MKKLQVTLTRKVTYQAELNLTDEIVRNYFSE